MILYTGRGDDGTSKTFAGTTRVSKASLTMEALGALDEVNSFLGLCKIKCEDKAYEVAGKSFVEIVHRIQQHLFIIQAEIAGAPKAIDAAKIKEAETIINAIEKELPTIKTFFIAGGSELATLFDVSRTQARRAERRIVAAAEAKEISVGKDTLAYMNRLSSVLYALARLSNYRLDIPEEPPSYK